MIVANSVQSQLILSRSLSTLTKNEFFLRLSLLVMLLDSGYVQLIWSYTARSSIDTYECKLNRVRNAKANVLMLYRGLEMELPFRL